MEREIIQITSGRGPVECCWVVAQVLKIFLAEANLKGIKSVVLDKTQGPVNRTIASVTVSLEGGSTQLMELISCWEGSILWIGQSEFRKMHKRKNWFVGFQKIQLGNQFEVNEALITYSAIRSGGPGGQHVNKVSSAIRAVYKPLNISVVASDNRSQNQNKKLARLRILEAISIQNNQQELESIKSNWQQHNVLKRGNPIRTFKGHNFKSEHNSELKKKNRKTEKQIWKNLENE